MEFAAQSCYSYRILCYVDQRDFIMRRFIMPIKEKATILGSFQKLRGNTRVSVMVEPMYGIPFALYNFYLSLYMKSVGISNVEIGWLIAINCVFSALFSLIGGVITDHLGRKRTTLIFDFLSWPVALIIYAVSNSFWMFALGIIMNSFSKVVGVSWNLMVIEDATNEERIAAFNLLNIINLATGVITPLAGIAVSFFGIIPAERSFILFAAACMVVMILLRNHLYVETKVGQEILDAKLKFELRTVFKGGIYGRSLAAIFKSKEIWISMAVYILFLTYIPIGTFSSLYYAPFFSEVLGIGKSTVSVLGAVNSAVMLLIFVLVIPAISRFHPERNMLIGILLQAAALLGFVLLPRNNLTAVIFFVVVFAAGFGLFRPFIDAILAEVTDGRERAGIYSLLNMAISVLSSLLGLVSGYLYGVNPRLIYILSIGLLMICVILLLFFSRLRAHDRRRIHAIEHE